MCYERADNKLWTLGCLWNGDEFSIITTQANKIVAPVHHRMALTLADDSIERFLAGEVDNIHLVPEELFKSN